MVRHNVAVPEPEASRVGLPQAVDLVHSTKLSQA